MMAKSMLASRKDHKKSLRRPNDTFNVLVPNVPIALELTACKTRGEGCFFSAVVAGRREYCAPVSMRKLKPVEGSLMKKGVD